MLLLGLTLALAGFGALGGALVKRAALDEPAAVDDGVRAAGGQAALTDWVGVLEGLDAARSRAYRDADPSALTRVYASGSDALREDQRLLRRYVARGLRVVGLRMQVVDLRLLQREPGRVELRVRDRLSAGDVVDDQGGVTALPADPLSGHCITLVQTGDGWRIEQLEAEG